MTLQRRLSGMERDLAAIQAKVRDTLAILWAVEIHLRKNSWMPFV